MKKLNNKGFNILEVLLVILVIATAGGIGAYVYHRNHKAKTVSSTRSSSSTSKGGGSTPTPKTYTSAEALKLVQDTYTTALNYVNQSKNSGQGEIDAVKSNLSTSLYNKLTTNVAAGVDHDQILCAQAIPSNFTTVSGSVAGNSATVFVNESFGSLNKQITATVDLISLKLTEITCPQ